MQRTDRLLGGIEAGGTKFICAIGRSPVEIVAEQRIPTTTPDETVAAALRFFETAVPGRSVGALGIASFGPVQLDRTASNWGHILATPKPGWSHFDLAGAFGRALSVPVAFETDVNGAALGELRYGAGQGMSDIAYVTVGTGIGGGIVAGGALVHGALHPEIGHIRPRRHALDRAFEGSCPFHGDCFEGLASGTAISRRCGAPLHQLPADHPMWEIEADYLAQLCAMLVLTTSPRRIILGGGVMQAESLLERVASPLRRYLGGYILGLDDDPALAMLVALPVLEGRSGVVGALSLAETALEDPRAAE